MCIGETLEQRESGELWNVLKGQLSAVADKLSTEDWNGVVVAYEPVRVLQAILPTRSWQQRTGGCLSLRSCQSRDARFRLADSEAAHAGHPALRVEGCSSSEYSSSTQQKYQRRSHLDRTCLKSSSSTSPFSVAPLVDMR